MDSQQIKTMKALRKRLLHDIQDVQSDIISIQRQLEGKQAKLSVLQTEVECVKSVIKAQKVKTIAFEEEVQNEFEEEVQNEFEEEVQNEFEEEVQNEFEEELQNEVEEQVRCSIQDDIQNEIIENVFKEESEKVQEEAVVVQPYLTRKRSRKSLDRVCPCGLALRDIGFLQAKGYCNSILCKRQNGKPRRCTIPLYYYMCDAEECQNTICQSCFRKS